ncbi:condensation domain-containing protein [Streptomyces sp. NPDC056987]|uniref:condensation domain-containing protein n=1 Tax=Streptomyces sp. NPDC056987 TaxID=3345988 RepID=UPI0036320BBB
MECQAIETVTFHGNRSAVGSLTWGQKRFYQMYIDDGGEAYTSNIPAIYEVPIGQSVPQVLEAIQWMISQHEALRTKFRVNELGEPEQVVTAEGDFPVEIYRTGDNDPRQACLTVNRRHWRMCFGWDEWPIRLAIVTSGGNPRYLSIVLSHLSADEWSKQVLLEKIDEFFTGHRRECSKEFNPLDLVARQGSDSSQRRLSLSKEYWERQLQSYPNSWFPVRGSDTGPAAIQINAESRAITTATRILAARYSVSTTTPIVASFAALMALKTGRDRSGFGIYSTTRRAIEERRAIGNMYHWVALSVSFRGVPFRDMVRRTWASTLLAHKHSEFDWGQFPSMLHENQVATGYTPDLDCTVNIITREALKQPALAGECTFGEIVEMKKDSIYRRLDNGRKYSHNLYLELQEIEPSMKFSLLSALLSEAELTEFARNLESLIVSAVSDDSLDLETISRHLEIDPAQVSPGLMKMGDCWVDVEVMRCAILAAFELRDGQIGLFLAPDGAGGDVRLELFLMLDESSTTLEHIHSVCTKALTGERFAVTPNRYVVCAAAPETPSRKAWEAQPAWADGSGRPN